jgi:integrase
MLENNLSPRTVIHSHRVLNRALTEAVRLGILLFNPADKISPPRLEKKELSVWSAGTIRDFLIAAKDSPYVNTFRLAALTGLRRSELAGLKWEDVDFKNNRIKVVRTLQRIPHHGIVEGQPKSHRSRRSIAISPISVSILQEVRAEQFKKRIKSANKWIYTAYVFTNDFGNPIDPTKISHSFRRILRKTELPHGTLHGLRHAFATSLLTANVHPAVVQQALGHSSINLTIDTYSHVMPGIEEAAARKIDEVIGSEVRKIS